MKKPAYYNEHDKQTAAWLRELIREGIVAPGVVDDRSIEDVHPSDLQDFTQCHFFAGIGVWSFALRAAGWPDDRPVWTGSCPCQPFSAAGEGAGFADERHLWPAFHHLIKQHAEWCRQQKRLPPSILGEQVASKDADPWIDLVQDDLEGLGYRVGAVPFPSAGVGAPHIRDRLYWAAVSGDRRDVVSGRAAANRLAYADGGHAGAERQQRSGEQRQQPQDGSGGVVAPGGLADDQLQQRQVGQRRIGAEHEAGGRQQGSAAAAGLRNACGLANDSSGGRGEERPDAGGIVVGDRAQGIATGPGAGGRNLRAGPTNGFWRDADWLGCRDGTWRPVEPGTFPLAHGAPARVLRLRGYGNAVNAEAAQAWIEVVQEVMAAA